MDKRDLIPNGGVIYAMDEITSRPIHIICVNGMLRVYVDDESRPWVRACKWVPLGYQQLSVDGVSVALSPPAGAVFCLIAVESKGIRYRDDGIAPALDVGMPINESGSLLYHGDLSAIRFIRNGMGFSNAIVNVNYYRYPE